MNEPSELDVTHAYSRQEIEVYLGGVEAQRSELEAAIAAARTRTKVASELERRLVALEQRVGRFFVEAQVQAGRRAISPPVFTDAPGIATAPGAAGRRPGAGDGVDGGANPSPPGSDSWAQSGGEAGDV